MNLDSLVTWMTYRGLGTGPLQHIAKIGGGTQNILLRIVRSEQAYVLRRGPLHPRPSSNRAILRETRVLEALSVTDVPHPRHIATCDDPTVLGGTVFYLMESVAGFNAGTEIPPRHAADASMRHQMGLELIDTLAALGAVDHVAVGLGDFGRPNGFLQRQVPRWLAELDSYRSYPNYSGEGLPGVTEIAAWLEGNIPTTWAPGIMHGDFHVSNALFSRSGPEVAAIVDWEMCTIGDPLLDLGWLLATWQLPDSPEEFGGKLAKAGSLASTEELYVRYSRNTTRDLSAITWYTVLACFKLGILLEGSLARAAAGKASMTIGARLHTSAVELFKRALTLLKRES